MSNKTTDFLGNQWFVKQHISDYETLIFWDMKTSFF